MCGSAFLLHELIFKTKLAISSLLCANIMSHKICNNTPTTEMHLTVPIDILCSSPCAIHYQE
jgi:hypothetical protein